MSSKRMKVPCCGSWFVSHVVPCIMWHDNPTKEDCQNPTQIKNLQNKQRDDFSNTNSYRHMKKYEIYASNTRTHICKSPMNCLDIEQLGVGHDESE